MLFGLGTEKLNIWLIFSAIKLLLFFKKDRSLVWLQLISEHQFSSVQFSRSVASDSL